MTILHQTVRLLEVLSFVIIITKLSSIGNFDCNSVVQMRFLLPSLMSPGKALTGKPPSSRELFFFSLFSLVHYHSLTDDDLGVYLERMAYRFGCQLELQPKQF